MEYVASKRRLATDDIEIYRDKSKIKHLTELSAKAQPMAHCYPVSDFLTEYVKVDLVQLSYLRSEASQLSYSL